MVLLFLLQGKTLITANLHDLGICDCILVVKLCWSHSEFGLLCSMDFCVFLDSIEAVSRVC